MQRSVIQIVPRLRAHEDGVSDYALVLGEAIRVAGNCEVLFLSADSTDELEVRSCEGVTACLRRRSRDELTAALTLITPLREGNKARSVLLHYVNYGYAARGCPLWLVAGLKDWRRRHPSARLVTIFHELYAMGPPWRSSFWLSPLQRYLALSLRDISDEVVTNRNLSRRWLVQGRPDMTNRMSVMPVFSTLGESTRIVPWAERAPQMVVGGRTGNAGRAYERCRDQLIDACRALEIVEIIDFGARQRLVPKRLGGVRISALGHLTPAEARAVVGNARAGFIDYPSDFLGKSTVFAAYAAHGLVPVVSHRRGEEEIGLKLGINYWVPLTGAPLPGSFEAIAANALTWYSGHSLGVQARTFGKLLHG